MTQSQNPDDLVTKTDALAFMPVTERISLRTLDRYIADGTIRRYRFHNGRVKVSLAEVLALLTPEAVPSSVERAS